MAALSVEMALLGKNTFTATEADLDWNVCRKAELAATPPDTRIARAPVSAAAARVRVTRSWTTADWKLEISERVLGLHNGSKSEAFRRPWWSARRRASISPSNSGCSRR